MPVTFTVRKNDGTIIKKSDEFAQDGSKHYLSVYGNEGITQLRSLTKYCRGKLRAELSYRDIPQKELYAYDHSGIELVLSEKAYNDLLKKQYYKEFDSNMITTECRVVDSEKLSRITIKNETLDFNTVAFFKYCENIDCRQLKYFSNMDDLKRAAFLYEWLDNFKNSYKFEIRTVSLNLNSNVTGIYVKLKGQEERYFYKLNCAQLKILKTISSKSNITIEMSETIAQSEINNEKIMKKLTNID